MANQNPLGSARFWLDGSVARVIDNGVTTLNVGYIGTTDYTFQGRAEGFIQGGPGSVGDSPQNLEMDTTISPQPSATPMTQIITI